MRLFRRKKSVLLVPRNWPKLLEAFARTEALWEAGQYEARREFPPPVLVGELKKVRTDGRQ